MLWKISLMPNDGAYPPRQMNYDGGVCSIDE